MTTPTDLPRLRPYARQGKPLYAELRALRKMHGEAMKAEVEAIKRERGGKIMLAQIVTIILRYRLSLFAGFEILEDVNALACGTYDRIKRGMRPSEILKKYMAEYPVPDAAWGVESEVDPC